MSHAISSRETTQQCLANAAYAACQFVELHLVHGRLRWVGCDGFTLPGRKAFAAFPAVHLFGRRRAGAFPMSRRDWECARPNSLVHALRLCKECAAERHHLRVERIADRMGAQPRQALQVARHGPDAGHPYPRV